MTDPALIRAASDVIASGELIRELEAENASLRAAGEELAEVIVLLRDSDYDDPSEIARLTDRLDSALSVWRKATER